MRKFFISFVCSLITTVGLFAQAGAAADGPISVEFVIYSWKCTLPELNYTGNQKIEALGDPFSLTEVHTYTGPRELAFYKGQVEPVIAGGEAPTPVATVAFSAESSKYIIVTARVAKDRYQMYAIPVEDSNSNEPYIRMHNFTEYELAIQYDGQKVVRLAPSAVNKVNLAGPATVLRVARFQDGQWLRAFNNVAELNESGPKDIIFASEGTRPVTMFNLPKWPGASKPGQEGTALAE
ncbi:hypothetical protein [Coraliomargarita parva]|uniref:hypothetical protein n=1 Tax=Coraliomargarita parva TaxID=3014050 RepID=UPI0022B451CB|nr:hypothetical protein [Coraliomargarita parva]